ncbi:MAG TPA: hypothetical protein VHM90_21535 [Phycisphaerae bacterium]|nr:hypothetical protein [Phycisphaerae bacterium]
MRKRHIAGWLVSLCMAGSAIAADEVRTLKFEGVLANQRFEAADLKLPADWSGYTHLVMEMKASTPQRFGLWVHTSEGVRRIEIQPLGQGAWLRASIPLQFLRGQVSGNDLAAATNRRTNSFWMSVWGPWGELKTVEAVEFQMEYPINHATIELRNVHLAKADEGSEFLDKGPGGQMTDQWGQWAIGDWPRKIHSAGQLAAELADEAKNFKLPADFGLGKFYGGAGTQAKATGFFHVEQQNGKWWFVDPEGHLFLATGINGTPGAGGAGRGRGRGAPEAAAASAPASAAVNPAASLVNRRLDSWGMTTGGTGRPNIAYFRAPAGQTWMGLPDVYSEQWTAGVDAAANQQLTPRRDDPWLVGYFIGNEPPWGGRESQVCDMILAGAATATQAKLKEYLAGGDARERRRAFVIQAYGKYLETVCGAMRKYDPNHLILGTRFGGTPSEAVLKLAHIFDVCSINVYEYEPTKQIERTFRFSGRPVMVTEFHIGVPGDGLGAGLVQAKDQKERGIAYRYFVEQAASMDCFMGDWWFQWNDEPVLGRGDGENYNIGFIDSTGRAYKEFVEAVQATNKVLQDVHAGKVAPFSQRPKASDLGAPSSPWDLDAFHGG